MLLAGQARHRARRASTTLASAWRMRSAVTTKKQSIACIITWQVCILCARGKPRERDVGLLRIVCMSAPFLQVEKGEWKRRAEVRFGLMLRTSMPWCDTLELLVLHHIRRLDILGNRRAGESSVSLREKWRCCRTQRGKNNLWSEHAVMNTRGSLLRRGKT